LLKADSHSIIVDIGDTFIGHVVDCPLLNIAGKSRRELKLDASTTLLPDNCKYVNSENHETHIEIIYLSK
jgi:hypothetical protein